MSLKHYLLNRLEIVGDISDAVPRCVIVDIADAHNISYDASRLSDSRYLHCVIKTITGSPVHKISFPVSNVWIKMVKKYLGIPAHESWSQDDLRDILDSWEHINSNIDSGIIPPISIIGPPSKEYDTLNICFLYKICKVNKIHIPPNATADHIATLASFCCGRQEKCVNILNSYLVRATMDKILPFMGHLPYEHISQYRIASIDTASLDTTESVNHETIFRDIEGILEANGQLYAHGNRNRSHLRPRNNIEAIMLAALNYQINLLRIPNPMIEYNIITRFDIANFPSGRKAIKIYRSNPFMFDLNTVFDPNLPAELYSNNQLRALATFEGIPINSDTNSSHIYEQLQLAYVSETFYPGCYAADPCNPDPQFSSETAFIGESIEDIPNNQIISFGIRSEYMASVTFDEMVGMIRKNKALWNEIPKPGGILRSEPLSSSAVKKIKNICNLQGINREKSRELLNEIEIIENRIRTLGESMINFSIIYESLDTRTKQMCIRAIHHLFELAMYMRNWDGTPGVYPIATTPPIVNQYEIDLRVTQKLAVFENHIRGMGVIGEHFMNLPIYKYETGVFVPSREHYNGFTLKDRIALVKNGDETDNVSSCIRLSSNYFAASSIVYSRELQQPDLFNISLLTNIT
jgi:hypothetical protein